MLKKAINGISRTVLSIRLANILDFELNYAHGGQSGLHFRLSGAAFHSRVVTYMPCVAVGLQRVAFGQSKLNHMPFREDFECKQKTSVFLCGLDKFYYRGIADQINVALVKDAPQPGPARTLGAGGKLDDWRYCVVAVTSS